MTENTKLQNLQCLRAVACLLVVLFHLAGALSASGHQNMVNNFFLRIGASGVDVFFVISGFVMVYIQLKRKTKPLRFIQNRVARIAPLYWVLTITMALVLLMVPNAFNTNQFAMDRFVSSVLFSCGLIMQKETLVYPGWTIEYEVLFYVVFFFSLYLRKVWLSILFASLILVGLVVYGHINSIALEFIFGMVIGGVYCTKTFSKWVFVASTGFGAICIVMTGLVDLSSFGRVLVWGVPSCLVVFGLAGINQSRSNFLTVLGDGSYSIYLAQAFLIPVFMKSFDRVWRDAPYPLLFFLGFAFVALVGLLCFFVIEINLTRFTTKVIGRLATTK